MYVNGRFFDKIYLFQEKDYVLEISMLLCYKIIRKIIIFIKYYKGHLIILDIK
jgi:hypothetical protein